MEIREAFEGALRVFLNSPYLNSSLDASPSSIVQDLPVGQILEAKVVTNPEHATDPTRPPLALMIDGEKYATKLPPEVKEGDIIRFVVTEENGQKILKVLDGIRPDSAPATRIFNIDEVLPALLQKLNIKETEVQVLIDSLKLIASPKEASLALQQYLEGALYNKDVPIITEQAVKNPEFLAKILEGAKSADRAEVLKFLTSALNIDSTSQGTSSTTELLDKLSSALQSAKPNDDPQSSSYVAKLLQVLKTLPEYSKTLLVQGEQTLEDFLKNQFYSLGKVEGDMKTALSEAFSSNDPIRQLITTLDRAAKIIPEAHSQGEEAFLQFTASLKNDLERLLRDNPVHPEDIKKVLDQALKTLGENFGVNSKEPVLQQADLAEVIQDLPRKALVLLKSVEVQIRAILESPDLELANIVNQSPDLNKLQAALKEIIKSSAEIELLLSKDFTMPEGAKEQLSLLKTTIQDLSKKSSSPEQIKEALVKVLERFTDLQTSLSSITLSSITQRPLETSSTQDLPKPSQELLKAITRQISDNLKLFEALTEISRPEVSSPQIDTLRQMPLAGPTHIQSSDLDEIVQLARGVDQRNQLLKDPNVALILRMVKQLDVSALGNLNPAEKQFVDYLKDLAQKLPASHDNQPKERDSVPTREQVKDALAKVGETFRNESNYFEARGNGSQAQDTQLRSVLNSLEQVFRSQEILERLNPIMNALGEPALILFPAIISGFISQIELLSYPTTPTDEGDESDEDGSASSKKKGGYKRFDFEIKFRGLGLIQTQLCYREAEILLNVHSESPSVAAFINSRLPRLEGSLQRMGYTKTSLRATCSEKKLMKPKWVPALLAGSHEVLL